jgi:3-hydroxyisobutyrate dehydrogenase-like beta-hydroxyacid dehydrogenase
MKLGFVGLGHMGSGMARNLAAAGHEVTVWNRSREKAEALVSAPGSEKSSEKKATRVASSPAEAAKGAEAVFTMLADDHATEEAVFGENGLASALPAGAIHIASSTISTEFARHLASEHAKRKQGYLSAPVFGRPEAAAAGKLLVVAGGAKELIDRVKPLFESIGRATFIAGSEPWQANLVKVCGNLTIIAIIETLGEVFATLKKSGVEPGVLMDAINELHGSPVYKNYGGMIVRNQFEPAGFALKLGLKDVRLVLKAADECGAPLPLASLIHDQLLSALANGQGDKDWASLAQIAARNAGV